MEENFLKNWLTAAVFEYSCKNDFTSVIGKVIKDEELSSNLPAAFTGKNLEGKENVKPVFLFTQILKQLLSSVETFASENNVDSYPWNSDALPNIIKMLEKTYEQCDFISLKKFFSLLSQLKFLDLMYLLRHDVESAVLMQKLNLYFPRWHATQKALLEKKFSIQNPKILDKVEESYSQCRRLMLKLVTDSSYRSFYMKNQFFNDLNRMVIDSVVHLKEIIANLNSNAGLTVIEKSLANPASVESGDLGHQLLLDYFEPEITPEGLLRFLDEIEPALEPPNGGFSSCLLPFDTLSECSDVQMDSECDESGSEASDDSYNKDKTLIGV